MILAFMRCPLPVCLCRANLQDFLLRYRWLKSGVDETEGILLMNGEDLAATLTVSTLMLDFQNELL